MRKILCILSLITVYSLSYGQAKKSVRPLVTTGLAEYEAQVRQDSNKRMVEIQKIIPSIKLDLKYASKDNFAKQQFYPAGYVAYLRLIVAKALAGAQAEFQRLGYSLLIWDAYRPYSVTVKMYNHYPNKTYLAPPSKGSRHNRGCAVDLTLIELKTGRKIPMPTDFDSFSAQAFPKAEIKDAQKLQNRELLIRIMQKYGFKVSLSEWWHFDFVPWKKYELLDLVSFPEL